MIKNPHPATLLVRLGIAVGLLVSLSASIAFAQTGSEDLSWFGSLGQGNASVTGPQALRNNSCVPTATANALTYLENYYQFGLDLDSPFFTTPNTYGNVNQLISYMGTTANGTYISGMFNGLQNFLKPFGGNPAPTISLAGQNSPDMPANWLTGGFQPGLSLTTAIPSASFLANGLNQNFGVTLSLQWGTYSGTTWNPSGGAHELTLTSINVGSDGNGTIGLIDPWGTGLIDAAGSSVNISATVSTINGYLYVSYPLTAVGVDGDVNPDPTYGIGSDGETGRILGDMIIQVPEPSMGALAILSLLVIFGRRLLRRLAVA